MYLNCRSWFSLKYGVLSPKELLEEAHRAGIKALALTDINNTSGILEFFRLAPRYGIHPVAGIEFRDKHEVLFIGLARNNTGWRILNEHLTRHLIDGAPLMPPPASDDIWLIFPANKPPVTQGKRFLTGIKPSGLPMLASTALRQHLNRAVALLPVTFRNKRDFNIHRLLRAIDANTLLSKLNPQSLSSPEERLMPPVEVSRVYARYPELLQRAEQVLMDCQVDFAFGEIKNKKTFTGDEQADYQLLTRATYEGLEYRYGKPSAEIIARVEKELNVIRERQFTAYFLICHDLVRYAKNRGFYHVGRGSGANSIVAYCLGITDVDPIELHLYFERFINPSRVNPPDFDIDFSWTERDEILRYLFEKYPHRHVALLAAYNTFQRRAAIRELGKVFGLPGEEITRLEADIDPRQVDNTGKIVLKYASLLKDKPSHLSIHAGGVLISEAPLTCYSALEMPPKGFPITQFSMLEAEDAGLYKFDILSQRGLGKITDTLEIIAENHPDKPPVDIHDIARIKNDPAVKEKLRNADAIGCFYIESPAMRTLLKKLQVDDYPGLVAASSIIRPGVARSGMMRTFILRHRYPERRHDGPEKLREILPETYGVMVYQEDVIKVAHEYAGLTLAESDVLRRGMSGKFRSREEFQKVRDRFFENCHRRGYPPEEVADIWRQIESFAGYAFAKGHSASYAVESFQALYLKAHYPLEYMVATINNYGGFYRTEIYVHEARRCGGIIEPPCVNHSRYLTSIRGKTIYLGFHLVKSLEYKLARQIEKERAKGPFKGLHDFIKRIQPHPEQLQLLIRVGAFRFTGKGKKELMWEAHMAAGQRKKTPLTGDLFASEEPRFQLPELHYDPFEEAIGQIELLGFPLCNPFDLLAEGIPSDTVPARDLDKYKGKTICSAGYLVAVKYTRTVKGERMFFGTFLDKNGDWLDTVHFPDAARKFPFRGTGIYLLKGKVTEEFDVYTLEVSAMEKLPYKIIPELHKG